MPNPHRLQRMTLMQASTEIAAGRLSSEALARACLVRIAEREAALGAWAFIDPEAALVEARERDREQAQGSTRGPLHGVPIGIKDIIDTAEMPTAYGSPIYAEHRPAADAACVALLREAGAVILGKTVTTEFAAVTPGKTVNPHDPAHSPGGSSSGSAAAVADFMVPAALGTQTVGSTIRPASYCGVVGFKPSYQSFSLAGVHAQAESLDTLGLLARSVGDLAPLCDALLAARGAFRFPALDKPPRIGFCRSPHWPGATPATVRVMDKARELFTRAGAMIEDVELGQDFERALDAQWTVLRFEFARVMAHERRARREGLSLGLQKLLDAGLALPLDEYRAALALLARCRTLFAPIIERYDALLTPAAASEAPRLDAGPSDLLFQRLWTALHVPALTLPGFVGDLGLPIGIQLIGAHAADPSLLAVGEWAESVMHSIRSERNGQP